MAYTPDSRPVESQVFYMQYFQDLMCTGRISPCHNLPYLWNRSSVAWHRTFDENILAFSYSLLPSVFLLLVVHSENKNSSASGAHRCSSTPNCALQRRGWLLVDKWLSSRGSAMEGIGPPSCFSTFCGTDGPLYLPSCLCCVCRCLLSWLWCKGIHRSIEEGRRLPSR